MNATPEFDFELEPERYELIDSYFNAEQTRREFFRIAGAGVIVALLMGDEAAAQQPKGGNAPREIGAWIHIGEDSAVTAYTGKVEIGQNIRTSLTQVVAEELRAPLKTIRVVTADTSLVPFDAGTFGSRTTPAMASQLRRAAAAARETLLDLAAEQGKVARDTLAVAEGKVAGPDGKPSYTCGQLTKGQKLLKVIAATVPTAPPNKWTVAGNIGSEGGRSRSSPARTSTLRTSASRGMLFGKVPRAPAMQAKLVSVNEGSRRETGSEGRAGWRPRRRGRANRARRRSGSKPDQG